MKVEEGATRQGGRQPPEDGKGSGPRQQPPEGRGPAPHLDCSPLTPCGDTVAQANAAAEDLSNEPGSDHRAATCGTHTRVGSCRGYSGNRQAQGREDGARWKRRRGGLSPAGGREHVRSPGTRDLDPGVGY